MCANDHGPMKRIDTGGLCGKMGEHAMNVGRIIARFVFPLLRVVPRKCWLKLLSCSATILNMYKA